MADKLSKKDVMDTIKQYCPADTMNYGSLCIACVKFMRGKCDGKPLCNLKINLYHKAVNIAAKRVINGKATIEEFIERGTV